MAFTDAQASAIIYEGTAPLQVTLAGTVKKGDAVGYSSGWQRALATVGTAIQIMGVAAEDGVSGDIITIFMGPTIVGGSRFSGATLGAALYVAEGTDSGEYTETAPTTTGDCNTVCGYVIEEGTTYDKILVMPNVNAKTTA